jgi:uncharacterized protein (TIGR02391 family)
MFAIRDKEGRSALMAKRSSGETPIQAANLTPDGMRQGIIKIERRIIDLRGLDIQKLTSGSDPKLLALEKSIETTLVSVFGLNTVELKRYRDAATLDLTAYVLSFSGSGTSLHEVHQGIVEGRNRAIALLEEIIRSFKETLDDLGESRSGRALRAYEGLDLHPEIERAAGELYRGGHYANAIEDAVKALNDLVRLRSGLSKDGMQLMESAFSPSAPILKFNDLIDASDRDEQKGFMMMFTGAVAGLRNPRAHKLIKDDPERALEFIAYVSLLAKLLDGAKK